jgi:predicted alpha/beta-fold hydrolase
MSVPGFRPLPLLGNPHVQTVLGTLSLGRGCPPPQERHLLRLADGDRLLLYENTPRPWRAGGPVALVAHGLTGSHRSPHVVRLTGRLLRKGWRVFRIDLRGAGEGVTLARGAYHAGRSEDLREAVEHLHRLTGSEVWLVGVSLSGNMALKLAAESAACPVAGLAGVAALSPPIDMLACSEMISRPENRMYERRFVRALVENARLRGARFPEAAPPPWDERSLTLREFDDLVTGPRNGFGDAVGYYRAASSAPLIPRILLPALILTAADDPFIDVRPFRALRCGANVEVRVEERGGHVGFVGWDGAGGMRWGEWLIAEWLVRREASARG